MTEPLVSISCNTYNHANYIAQAIESFLAQQTDFPIEILIHDDASTDGTADIIRQYQARYPQLIKPICQAQNQQSQGVRIGRFNIERARGEYIALCEGDDYWIDPLKLRKQVECLQLNANHVMCFTNFNIINKQGEILRLSAIQKTMKTDLSQWQILSGLTPKYLTVMFRRRVLDLAFFRERFSNSGDVVLFSLLTRNGDAKYLDFISGCYRLHPSGTWSGRSEVDQRIMKLRSSVAIRTIFNRPREAEAIRVRIGKILFEILRVSWQQRSLRALMIFLRELAANFSSFGYFLAHWRQHRRKNRIKLAGKGKNHG
jgi:glycosyltransferase involved in cell wall biosynthesis